MISVFRVLSGGDEVRALVTRLFPQGHNPTCHTGEFTKLNLFNVTGKINHVTTLPTLTGDCRLRKLPLASLKQHGGPENKKKANPGTQFASLVSTRKQNISKNSQNKHRAQNKQKKNKQKHRSGATLVPNPPKS